MHIAVSDGNRQASPRKLWPRTYWRRQFFAGQLKLCSSSPANVRVDVPHRHGYRCSQLRIAQGRFDRWRKTQVHRPLTFSHPAPKGHLSYFDVASAHRQALILCHYQLRVIIYIIPSSENINQTAAYTHILYNYLTQKLQATAQ